MPPRRPPAHGSIGERRRTSDTGDVDSDLHLSFLGGATIYQGERKFDVDVTLYTQSEPSDLFFGQYDGAVPEGIESGRALIRFSDASQAEAFLAAVDPDRGGFRLTTELQELRRDV
jgi:hypothetical protein